MNSKEYLDGLAKQGHPVIHFTTKEFYESKTGNVMDAGGIPSPKYAKVLNVMEGITPIFTLNFVPLTVEFEESDIKKQIQREVMTGVRNVTLDEDKILTEKDWYDAEYQKMAAELLGTQSYHTSIIFWNKETQEKVAIINVTWLYKSEALLGNSIYISTEHNGKKESLNLYEDEGCEFVKQNLTDDVDKFKQVVISGIEKYLYSFHD